MALGLYARKPLIGVSTSLNDGRSATKLRYSAAIEKAGGIPVLIPLTKDGKLVEETVRRLDGILFVVLAVYAALWCKYRLKRPLFQPYEIKEVMAMENELYIPAHKRWEEKQKAAGKMAKTASAR